ncbi:ABC transporter ATP-binding protein [Clostridia bacterium]|nr:ABC transporter ATP-binding protein [Clostridia bacterium]
MTQQTSVNGTPLLSLENIEMIFYKKTGGFGKPKPIRVLENISLDIHNGEVLALVGESGGGKTTIGNIIAGLLKPTGGIIRFDGKNINDLSRKDKKEYRRSIQIVQQDSYSALNPARTIFQSLSAPVLKKRIVKNSKDAYQFIRELLELVELKPFDQFVDKYPHQLSGGQRQRVLLARALSLKPQLIVADEPVSMIDVSLRISILNLMSKLNRESGIAFLYVTHDLATARYISRTGNIGVLYLGELVELGAVHAVIEHPRHPYLQALLAAVPVPDPWLAKKRRKVMLRDVEVPSIMSPPSGCRFHPRCIHANERCANTSPELRTLDGRQVACHRAEEIPEFSFLDEEA